MTDNERADLTHDLIDEFSIIIRNEFYPKVVMLTEYKILEIACKLTLATIDILEKK